MGMLKEMFGEESNDNYEVKPPVLLAKGRYESNAETILSGYKTYQHKYVIKNVVLKMILVLLALASSVMMLISSDDGSMMPVLLIMICICAGCYFINEPIQNRKKLKAGLASVEGTEYEVEITNRTIKITTVENLENTDNSNISDDISEKTEVKKEKTEISEENPSEKSKNSDEKDENTEITDAETEEDPGPPATIIHLDGAVEIIDREDMFIICVSKKYIFIVPKNAFKEDELQAAREKLAAVMGVRFKMVD
jgi:hypothetical protein